MLRSVRSFGRVAFCAGVVESVDLVHSTKDGLYLKLRGSPGGKTTEVKGLYGQEALKLSVAAPLLKVRPTQRSNTISRHSSVCPGPG